MGVPIHRDTFDEADYLAFADRLESNLEALRLLLDRPGFGVGPPTIGAELEMSLVDAGGEPLLLNEQILAALSNDAFTVEANRFNLECNTAPVALAGTPFARLATELKEHTGRARTEAAAHGGRVILIGILPTLRPEHFAGGVMTDTPRFRAMDAGLRRLKREPFQVHIRGEDVLRIDVNDSTLEGSNTSFQLHLRVDPADFADTHNAAQMATGVALAVAGNAPVFLGCRLWEETRIALFKQAVDDRGRLDRTIGRAPRVSFGLDWTDGSAYPLFEESVRHHAPILPVVDEEDPVALASSGDLPRLAELRLHHGTTWRWNRAVYDPAGGGHLRIEFRALPAGPTVIDMMASAAFMLGLTLGLTPRAPSLVRELPFDAIHDNFYRAAQDGLAADLNWHESGQPVTVRARDLAERMLPVAERGLAAAGVAADESARLLGIVAARIERGRTGAGWQRRRLADLERSHDRARALAIMLDDYVRLSETEQPVHTWPT